MRQPNYSASLSCSTLEPAAEPEFVKQHYQWFNEKLERLTLLFNQQFPMFPKTHGLSLMTDSHAIILGLWQQNTRHGQEFFVAQATSALARLWQGYFAK
jgi:hypothetical protein